MLYQHTSDGFTHRKPWSGTSTSMLLEEYWFLKPRGLSLTLFPTCIKMDFGWLDCNSWPHESTTGVNATKTHWGGTVIWAKLREFCFFFSFLFFGGGPEQTRKWRLVIWVIGSQSCQGEHWRNGLTPGVNVMRLEHNVLRGTLSWAPVLGESCPAYRPGNNKNATDNNNNNYISTLL